MTVLFFFLSALKPKTKELDKQVMIYGIVYVQECNSESVKTYTYKFVSAINYISERQALEKSLRKLHPNAKRIQMSSSKFQYGDKASNVCILGWTKKENNCTYSVVNMSFGETQAEALENAIKNKNIWAGSKADYEIKEQKFW